jgi:hypothetical protein
MSTVQATDDMQIESVRIRPNDPRYLAAVDKRFNKRFRASPAFINHPDTDLADPTLNTSGVLWNTLYYKENYPRLQRIKARWDPRSVFRHALSIRVG